MVTRTGANTVMGKMTLLTENNRKRDTLITRELGRLIHILTGAGLSIASLFFILAFALGYFWIDAILFLVGTIVAVVPEGLLAVVTICLSLSVKRLYTRHMVIKNLEVDNDNLQVHIVQGRLCNGQFIFRLWRRSDLPQSFYATKRER